MLQNALTMGEMNNACEELILVTRRTLQDVMGPELVPGPEQITQRKVCSSAPPRQPDIAIETFLLAPSIGHIPAQ